jgi:hypothetical protein
MEKYPLNLGKYVQTTIHVDLTRENYITVSTNATSGFKYNTKMTPNSD